MSGPGRPGAAAPPPDGLKVKVAVALPPELREMFFPAAHWSRLVDAYETTLVRGDHRDPEVVGALLAETGAQVLLSGWGTARLEDRVLAAAPDLRLLAHTGATVKPLVSEESWRRGVRVTQAGQAMAPGVAEAALAHTLALLHGLHRFDHAMRTGTPWEQAQLAPPRRELHGSTVGVVGASRTGRAYLTMVLALGANVLVHDPYLDDAEAAELGVRRCGLDELLRASRVVAVHAPVLPETHHLLGARELALLTDGAMLVNTARSWLVDQAALLAELRSGRIDAALDVYDEEPLPVDHPFRALPNALLVPHQAGGTLEARWRAADLLIEEIGRFGAGLPLRHEVTRDQLARMG
ncbi:hydroxyacid dehydrogenase [Actinopolymorpha pittospori]|uniref:Phosphoglycerate dehydrogenase-like enzyme n=1 Tax=Actinopolymorpha pittospori TaxID=648752 RepID=A0A927N218_9ACTN|nr:phosphoglycerate dehydrogenase-like enzyme [Actinopolymorpha pittospori]